MYSGNGNNSRTSYGTPTGSSNYISIAGLRIKPLYLYIGVGVVALIGVYLLLRFLNTSLVMHFGAAAGVLLLLANLRELLGASFAQRNSTALLNVLIAAALICAWLTQLISTLLWIPAVLLLLIAMPLAFSRAAVYGTYVGAARSAVSNARRVIGR